MSDDLKQYARKIKAAVDVLNIAINEAENAELEIIVLVDESSQIRGALSCKSVRVIVLNEIEP